MWVERSWQGPLTVSLSPKGEGTQAHNLAASHLSLWGRGRREAAGEGAFATSEVLK